MALSDVVLVAYICNRCGEERKFEDGFSTPFRRCMNCGGHFVEDQRREDEEE